jgi:predicted DNA-binding transcriptional regulator YafY
MRKADRLLQVVNLIRSQQPVGAHKIAEQLDVSVRTVYRYIDDLSVSGMPVSGEPGVGYSLDKYFELAPISLTMEEFTALILALELLKSSVGGRAKSVALSLTTKIHASNPGMVPANRVKGLFSMVPPPEEGPSGNWWTLSDAISKNTPVSVSYHSLNGAVTDRIILPLAMFYWDGKWTVGAWCTKRQDFRDFRVDRFLSVSLSPVASTETGRASLSEYLQVQAANCSE